MDLKNKGSKVAVMFVSPGWVKTKLSGWLGDTDIDESVEGMISVIKKLNMENTGGFWNQRLYGIAPVLISHTVLQSV